MIIPIDLVLGWDHQPAPFFESGPKYRDHLQKSGEERLEDSEIRHRKRRVIWTVIYDPIPVTKLKGRLCDGDSGVGWLVIVF